MLVVLCRNLRGDIHFVSVVEGLVRLQTVRVNDSGCFYFKLDGSVEGKVEVEAILVVGYRTDGRDNQFSITSDVNSHISEIGMLVEYTRIFFTGDLSVIEFRKIEFLD
jgi:uncharacterized membrane protein